MEACEFGKEVPDPTAIFEKIRNILYLNRRIDDFIGSHPVSLERAHIDILLNEDYYVCEKSDGIRVLLLIDNGVMYLYDRKNKIFKTNIITQLNESYLFDGELYKEENYYIYAIFDTLIFKNENCLELNLQERLQKGHEFCKPANLSKFAESTNSIFKRFYIKIKQMTKSYGFFEVLDSIPKLKHENDGLIFTPLHKPYVMFERSNIFKWKPPHLNTVDFRIVPTELTFFYNLECSVPGRQCSVYTGNMESDRMAVIGQFYSSEEPETISYKIGEFKFNKEGEAIDTIDYSVSLGAWELYKIRTDKTKPNNFFVAMNVVETIQECITEEELRSYWQIMAKNYKQRQSKSALIGNTVPKILK